MARMNEWMNMTDMILCLRYFPCTTQGIQSHHCGSTRSPWVPARYGLPQGSVLGPLLYIMYTSDLTSLPDSYAALAQLYTDDVQVYLLCIASATNATTWVVSSIMMALEAWMSSNRLQLNSAKTQFIWLGTRQQLAKLDMSALADIPQFHLLLFCVWP